MKKYCLYLDDVRIPPLYYFNQEIVDWIVVRDYKQFVEMIESKFQFEDSFPSLISFDHDLTDAHYVPEMYDSIEQYNKVAVNFIEKTGLDCAKWLIEFVLEHNVEMPKITIHSMNPVGRQRIQNIFDDYYKLIQK
ncbi:MAG: hypothetical protein M0R17_08490 [Candidatus Omnitrophica bacterium]|jgi:hypothetical protein|nr:hypothetical protein [Candidatus Omnitrophota bacterium]